VFDWISCGAAEVFGEVGIWLVGAADFPLSWPGDQSAPEFSRSERAQTLHRLPAGIIGLREGVGLVDVA